MSTTGPKVVFIVMGTIGDVLPIVTVAHSIAQTGVPVTFCTHQRFLHLVQPPVTRRELPFDPVDILLSRSGSWMVAGGMFGTKRALGTYQVIRPRLRATLHTIASVSDASNVVVHSGLPFGAHDIFTSRPVRHMRIHLQPHWPNPDHKSLYLSCPGSWGPALNAFSHRAVDLSTRLLFGRHHRRILRELAISPRAIDHLIDPSYWSKTPSIFSVSRPFVNSTIAGQRTAVVTGFIRPMPYLPGLSHALLRRITKLPRPRVLMTFGSMVGRRVRVIDAHLCHLAARGDISLIRQVGWEPLGGASGNRVVTVPPLDHDELMRSCDVLVHHGGSGTVAASLRAGRPMVVAPQWFDQFFWSEACQALGVAVSLGRGGVEVERLAAAIRTCVRAKSSAARATGPELAGPDGAPAAAAQVLSIVDGSH